MLENTINNAVNNADSELITQSSKPSKFKTPLVLIVFLLLVISGFYLIQKLTEKPEPVLPAKTFKQVKRITPTPTPVPLTSQNVDSELMQTDTNVQDATTQMNNDLNSIDQIDASQDSITF